VKNAASNLQSQPNVFVYQLRKLLNDIFRAILSRRISSSQATWFFINLLGPPIKEMDSNKVSNESMSHYFEKDIKQDILIDVIWGFDIENEECLRSSKPNPEDNSAQIPATDEFISTITEITV